MKKATWEKKIKEACKEAGTYKPFFDSVINTLASIMEIRDEAVAQYEISGGNPVVQHTNKGGHANVVKNPALAIITEMNQQALAYWRDLGLTPKGFQAMQKNGLKKHEASFEDILSDIGI